MRCTGNRVEVMEVNVSCAGRGIFVFSKDGLDGVAGQRRSEASSSLAVFQVAIANVFLFVSSH